MRNVTPKQKWNQILLLSKLVEKPMRFNELWTHAKTQIKSKETFVKNLGFLRKEGIIERMPKNSRHITYRISEVAEKTHGQVLSLARRISAFGSVELIADCMDFLASSQIFEDEEKRVQASIDFWVERYRNLCVLDALYSLPIFENTPEVEKEKVHEIVMMQRRMYQLTEDRFFEVLLRFVKRHPESSRSILERKLFLKGIELKPSWLGMKLSRFLKAYYPHAYEKLGRTGESKMRFVLLEKEIEKEYFQCLKFDQELPRLVCSLCRYRPLVGACEHRKIRSVKEKILAKRKHWPKQYR